LNSLLLILAGLAGYEASNWIAAFRERRELYAQAKKAAGNKPLLVVGVPRMRHGRGDAVIDLNPDGHPNTFAIDITDLSDIRTDTFGAAFVGHVLEHVEDIDTAMAELDRVADQVFVAYPRSHTLVAWLYPGHKHILSCAPPEGSLQWKRNSVQPF
jgi:hypothetical protein